MNLTPRKRLILLACSVAAILGGSSWCFAEGNQVVARPLTPREIHNHGLPEGTQTSGGLFTVGLGAPVYLEAQVLSGTVVSGVVWSITAKPTSSTAELMESPLGEEIPIYNPGDREVNEVAGRMLLKPDVVGVYEVQATVTTDAEELILTAEVVAATYVGVGTIDGASPVFPQCALCHAEQAEYWATTGHSTFFTEAVDGLKSSHYGEGCISCHNVGFDPSEGAENGGFDDVASAVGWVFPEVLEPGNWAAMPAELKAVSNIQCENCHGPGSEHFGRFDRISVSTSSGDCAQCHDDEPYHVKNLEWNNSRHAIATRYPTGEGRESCVSCHSGIGFIDATDGVPTAELRTEWEAIVCAACHDPHAANNPHQLRVAGPVTLGNGDMVTLGGKGQLCMNCHKGRRDVIPYVEEGRGSSHFGPHHGPQTDMLAGSNAYQYGRPMPKSTHINAVADSCTTCHLQETTRGTPENGNAGGHTFKMVYDGGTPEDHTDDVHLTGACTACHGEVESFDSLVRQDYDGNGIVSGTQTEVRGLLDKLGVLLPPVGDPEVAITSDFTTQQLAAAFNYQFVLEDGSYGIHNTAYATALLQASISDMTGMPMTGDADDDCLPDAWEIEQFGDITSYNGKDDPDFDGVENVMEYSVRTNPMSADSDSDGFSDLEELHVGTNPLDAEDTPETGRSTIYHAAELVFFTEAGKTYQVQAVASLGSAWENVGESFEGTGAMMQTFVSTRDTLHMFYRVVEVQ